MLRLVPVFPDAAAVVATSPPAVAVTVAAVSALSAAAWRRRMVGRPLVASSPWRRRYGASDTSADEAPSALQGRQQQAAVAELMPQVALRHGVVVRRPHQLGSGDRLEQ